MVRKTPAPRRGTGSRTSPARRRSSRRASARRRRSAPIRPAFSISSKANCDPEPVEDEKDSGERDRRPRTPAAAGSRRRRSRRRRGRPRTRSEPRRSSRAPPRPPRGRRPRACSPARGRRRPLARRDQARRRSAAPPRARRPRSSRVPGAGLDLDPARARELGRRPALDDLAADEDRDPVADQLDLAEQVRAQQHRRSRARAPRRAARGRPAGRPGRGRSWARRAAAGAARRPAPGRSRAAAASPSTSPPTRVAAAVARPTSSSSSRRSAAPPARAARAAGAGAAARRRVDPGREAKQLGEVADRRPRRRLPAAWPATRASPAVGRTRPQAIFASVDLPAPLGPSRPTISPSATSSETPRSASVGAVALAQAAATNALPTPPSLVERRQRIGSGGPGPTSIGSPSSGVIAMKVRTAIHQSSFGNSGSIRSIRAPPPRAPNASSSRSLLGERLEQPAAGLGHVGVEQQGEHPDALGEVVEHLVQPLGLRPRPWRAPTASSPRRSG